MISWFGVGFCQLPVVGWKLCFHDCPYLSNSFHGLCNDHMGAHMRRRQKDGKTSLTRLKKLLATVGRRQKVPMRAAPDSVALCSLKQVQQVRVVNNSLLSKLVKPIEQTSKEIVSLLNFSILAEACGSTVFCSKEVHVFRLLRV